MAVHGGLGTRGEIGVGPNLLAVVFDIVCGSFGENARKMKADEKMVAEALAGGPEAFEPIVRRYQDAVFGVALARLQDFHEAEDVAQQVFLRALEILRCAGE